MKYRTGIYIYSKLYTLFSSPELKARVSFSDCLLSVVRPFVCKLFPFSSSSPDSWGQFWLNIAIKMVRLRCLYSFWHLWYSNTLKQSQFRITRIYHSLDLLYQGIFLDIYLHICTKEIPYFAHSKFNMQKKVL